MFEKKGKLRSLKSSGREREPAYCPLPRGGGTIISHVRRGEGAFDMTSE